MGNGSFLTQDESFYIPPAAWLRTLFFRFAPSKRTQPLPARRALLLTSPCVFVHPGRKPRLSWRRRKALALPLRKPLPSPPAAEGITHQTLQARSCAKGGSAPIGFPATKPPGFFGFFPTEKAGASQSCFGLLCPKGSFPSGRLLQKGLAPLNLLPYILQEAF